MVLLARVATFAALLGSAVVVSAGAAVASTFTVTNTNASGAGSLNDAIATATAHPGVDTITFAASTNHHTVPEPDTIESDVTVKGNGAGVTVIAGEFNVNSGGTETVTAVLSDLSIGDFNINSGFGSSTTATITNVDVTNDGININSGFNNSKTTATLTNVKVTGGTGISANAKDSTTKVTISNSTVSGASSEPLNANDSGTTVTVTGSTFANNHDGIDVVADATLRMTNSTVTGGTEQGVRSRGHVTLQNVTITKNVGGAVVAFSGSMSIGNSILAGNDLSGGEESAGAECTIEDAAFTSLGGNLSDDSSCHPITGDHPKTQAKLGTLGGHGGPTQTFLPLSGSVAIDGGVAAGCPSTDQRGVARPQDGDDDGTVRCDVGAVEVAAAPTATTTPVTAASSPTTVAAAAELPRTGRSSGPLAGFGVVVLLVGIALVFGPGASRRVAGSSH
jgi:hypothetical protein